MELLRKRKGVFHDSGRSFTYIVVDLAKNMEKDRESMWRRSASLVDLVEVNSMILDTVGHLVLECCSISIDKLWSTND